MSHLNFQKPKLNLTKLRLIPYAVCGATIFSLTSATNLNYVFRGYLVLLEAQVSIVLIYFLMAKLTRLNKDKA